MKSKRLFRILIFISILLISASCERASKEHEMIGPTIDTKAELIIADSI